MALIQCPECGKEISDKATSCPNCGNPINIGNTAQNPSGVICPKCKSSNVSFQREETGSFGAMTNTVVIQPAKKSKGCLYWLFIGFWLEPLYWLMIGWWKNLLFGGRRKRGLNYGASKTMSRTMAVCQSCGYSWKV